MLQQRLLVILTLAALIVMTVAPAGAERLTNRRSQGNNIGMTCGTGWGMPWTGSWRGSWMYPKGSGNNITNDGCTMAIWAAFDKDGDGSAEDTTFINHMRAMTAPLASLERLDLITSIANSVPEGQVSAELSKIEYARIWTSLDDAEVADWPVEGRIGYTAGGEPDIAAAGETMFFHSSDVFVDWASLTPGGYYAWTLKFLDFAESNNMVYGHVYYRNMSEYKKYNTNSTYRDIGKQYPEGWTYKGAMLVNNMLRGCNFGSSGAGWMLHPEKGIAGLFPDQGPIPGWNPSQGPLIGWKLVNPPTHNGETMEMTAMHVHSGSGDFGFGGTKQYIVGDPQPLSYRVMLNIDQGLWPGTTNPWNGREVYGAWPGMVYPGEERYDQWIWGGAGNWQHYVAYGELHDIEPRDSLHWDWTYMLVYPGVDQLITPNFDLDQIDNPMMQEAFAPLEHYADVAEKVINSGFQVPATPSAPELTIVPGDRQVTVTWSDVNLQTPDPYYYFLESAGLNPNDYYREYDFEGYRLYRSFVGPNDSHSELLGDFNLSDGNVQFFYVDKLEDDQPFYRMRNGLKVWYAVVPYDRNYDPQSGEEFSLPALTSGKIWNRPGEKLYTVMSRSDASNYKPADLGGYSFSSGYSVSPAEGATAELAAQDGKITAAPVYLEPVATFLLEPVTSEKIMNDQTVSLVCTDMDGANWGGCNYPYGLRHFDLTSGGATVSSGIELGQVHNRGASNQQDVLIHGPVDDNGAAYAITATFDNVSQGDWRSNLYFDWDAGSYTGGTVEAAQYRCGSRIGSAPNMVGWTRSARYEITWQEASGGGLTIQVQDVTHNRAIPFGEQPDDYGWGFAPGEIIGDRWGSADNLYNQMVADIPKSERTNKMVDTLPADNTEGFGIWLNGIFWVFSDLTAMPAAGTTMTMTTVWGSWNSDGTAWVQTPDVPYPGDAWNIDINGMTMEDEDIELSRIKVVPNPYIASSFLDLSPDHRRIEFVNLPDKCTIRIYTLSGNLVNVLNHIGNNRMGWGNYTDWDRLTQSEPNVYEGYDNHSGTEPWNMRNRFGQTVASGLYFYHVTDARGETFTGKFYVIN